jgi:DNA repair exonuclease SbcCD ATPase subunit
MPKEKVLYVCDDKHNDRDIPLELEETVPYPENIQYGEKESVHYYYQCPFCFKPYLAYQKMGKPIEWSILDKEVWEKRIENIREVRINNQRKALDDQKAEIEKEHKETTRLLKEISNRKDEVIKEINENNKLLEQLKKDEEELSRNSKREDKELKLIEEKIDNAMKSP